MNKKKLIVNADDLGQSEGINAGIIKAFEKGIVTSASLMVRYPAAALAKKYTGLGIGLHVDLGEWIYRDGNWDPLYEVVALDDSKAVEDEMIFQLESFYRIMGKVPSHIDSHQHVHLRESLRPVFLALAHKLGITLRGCSAKVKYCGDFYGQSGDGSPLHDAISVEHLNRVIACLPEGITEIACHPGLHNDIKTMYGIEREMELNALCDMSVKETIANANIELCSFEGIGF